MTEFSKIARPYAKAIFAIANEDGELGAWSTALYGAAAVVGDAAAKAFLGRPELRAEQRAEFLRSVLADTAVGGVFASKHGKNLLLVLSENGRLAALPEIAAQFDKLKALTENKVAVTLVCAAEVGAAQVDKIAKALQQRLGRTVELEVATDPALVGGAVVRADDRVIDGSVRGRLQRLAGSLVD